MSNQTRQEMMKYMQECFDFHPGHSQRWACVRRFILVGDHAQDHELTKAQRKQAGALQLHPMCEETLKRVNSLDDVKFVTLFGIVCRQFNRMM